MLAAKLSSPSNAVAKARCAPGAMSCTSSSIAVPSSPTPAWPGSTSTSGGRSLVFWESPRESTPSDSTPTVTPTPLTPNFWRALSTPSTWTASDTTEPVPVAAAGVVMLRAASAGCSSRSTVAARSSLLGDRRDTGKPGPVIDAVRYPTAGAMWVTCGSAAVASTWSSGRVTRAVPTLSWLSVTLPPAARTPFRTVLVSALHVDRHPSVGDVDTGVDGLDARGHRRTGAHRDLRQQAAVHLALRSPCAQAWPATGLLSGRLCAASPRHRSPPSRAMRASPARRRGRPRCPVRDVALHACVTTP